LVFGGEELSSNKREWEQAESQPGAESCYS
jgi:hypothetical protein